MVHFNKQRKSKINEPFNTRVENKEIDFPIENRLTRSNTYDETINRKDKIKEEIQNEIKKGGISVKNLVGKFQTSVGVLGARDDLSIHKEILGSGIREPGLPRLTKLDESKSETKETVVYDTTPLATPRTVIKNDDDFELQDIIIEPTKIDLEEEKKDL
jgi:hypothetical protein